MRLGPHVVDILRRRSSPRAPKSARLQPPHLVVTLDKKSAPRAVFSGDQLVEVDMPAGTRCIYPRPPIEALKDVDAAIRYALNHPLNSDPLHAKLRPGMKVVIAIDDISLPLPPMRRPDVRERVLTVVLEMLADHGVEDVEIIIATSIHRRMTGEEVRHVVGDRIFKAYWPNRLYNHDAEDPKGMKLVGTTDHGEVMELNRRGGRVGPHLRQPEPGPHGRRPASPWRSVFALGKSLRAHHNPKRHARLLVVHGPVAERTGDERRADGAPHREGPQRLSHRDDGEQPHVRPAARVLAQERGRLVGDRARLVQGPRVHAVQGAAAGGAAGGVPAGAVAVRRDGCLCRRVRSRARKDAGAVHSRSTSCRWRGQADILVSGIPYISPYNVNSFLNPLLVQVMAQGYLFNLYKGAPLLKKGGTMIVFHPCTDQFDKEHHAPYIEFVPRRAPADGGTQWRCTRTSSRSSSTNPAYTSRCTGEGTPTTRPTRFYMWYWGEAGHARHIGRVIAAVGADNDYIPKLLGYETARSFPEALSMAQDGRRDLEITMTHIPPIVMAGVTA